MRKLWANNILVALYLAGGLLAYRLWDIVKDLEFYKCVAFVFALGSFIIMLNVRWWAKRFAFTAFISCCSTIIDDLSTYLLNNTALTINDYLITLVALLITFIPGINARFKR